VATLIPWTTVEVGDLDIFTPAVPCLVVNTWYMDDDEPDSTVTYFWQDEATGLINHEIVFAGPVSFEAALTWAQEHAPTRSIERIHVKHGPARQKRGRPAAKAGRRKKAAPRAKKAASKKVGRKKKAR
jgi:hypothetical protein